MIAAAIVVIITSPPPPPLSSHHQPSYWQECTKWLTMSGSLPRNSVANIWEFRSSQRNLGLEWSEMFTKIDDTRIRLWRVKNISPSKGKVGRRSLFLKIQNCCEITSFWLFTSVIFWVFFFFFKFEIIDRDQLGS